MTYQATVVQLLLSSPSDLPERHKGIVVRTIRTWNNSHGRRLGIQFSPTNWEEDTSPEFDTAPQDSVNRQIVDSSDLGLVIFTGRLGTPTEKYASGTVEEIERLAAQDKRVAIFRNLCARPPQTGTAAAQENARLEAYLEGVRGRALLAEYKDEANLLDKVQRLLTDEAQRAKPSSPSGSAAAESDLTRGVWPEVETERYQEADSKGRLKTKSRHRLVLRNETGEPVSEVSYRYETATGEPDTMFSVLSDHEPIALLAPAARHFYPMLQVMGSPDSTMCVVEWTDPRGVRRECRATIGTH